MGTIYDPSPHNPTDVAFRKGYAIGQDTRDAEALWLIRQIHARQRWGFYLRLIAVALLAIGVLRIWSVT